MLHYYLKATLSWARELLFANVPGVYLYALHKLRRVSVIMKASCSTNCVRDWMWMQEVAVEQQPVEGVPRENIQAGFQHQDNIKTCVCIVSKHELSNGSQGVYTG